MTTLLRHRQVGITRVSPHADNRRYAIPGGTRGLVGENPADATYYDGTDYLERSGELLNVTDTKFAIVSVWFRVDADNGIIRRIMDYQNRHRILITATDGFIFKLSNAAAGDLAGISSPPLADLHDGTFNHFVAAADLANTTAKYYWNGQTTPWTTDTVVDDFIDWTRPSNQIGSGQAGVNPFFGCIGEIYVNTKEYVDLDDPVELAKFISPGGDPVDMGANGKIPTGNIPTIYYKNGGRDGINLGDGGDYVVNGAPVKCTIPGPQA